MSWDRAETRWRRGVPVGRDLISQPPKPRLATRKSPGAPGIDDRGDRLRRQPVTVRKPDKGAGIEQDSFSAPAVFTDEVRPRLRERARRQWEPSGPTRVGSRPSSAESREFLDLSRFRRGRQLVRPRQPPARRRPPPRRRRTDGTKPSDPRPAQARGPVRRIAASPVDSADGTGNPAAGAAGSAPRREG